MEKQKFGSRMLDLSIIIIIAIAFTSNFKITYSQFSEEKLFKQMARVAEDIEKVIFNADVYVLGQSLTWIWKALEIMKMSRDTGNVIRYVPYSGDFLEFGREEGTGYFTSKDAELPTMKKLRSYRKLLQDLGLDPRSIVERFRKSGRKTVITDFIESGKGMASFMYILYQWAAEENIDLDDALEVFVLRAKNDPRDFQFLDINNHGIRVNLNVMYRDEFDLFELIMNPEEYKYFERLVVFYPHTDWDINYSDFTLERNPANVIMIKKITQYLQKYFKLETSFDELVKIAVHISTKFYNSSKVFFLEDLAWVGTVLEKINYASDVSIPVHLVSFTGDFSSTTGLRGFYMFKESDLPTEEEINNYRYFLRTIELDPKKIISDFINYGSQVVIADCVNTGRLASFLYFLLKWAEEEGIDLLSGALAVFTVNDSLYPRLDYINLNESEFSMNCYPMTVNSDLLNRLVRDDDPVFVRWLTRYPPHQWNRPPSEFDAKHMRQITETEQRLSEYLGICEPTEQPSATLSIGTTVLRTPPDDTLPQIDLELPSTSTGIYHSCKRMRYSRDLSSKAVNENPLHLIFTFNTAGPYILNRTVYEALKLEHLQVSRHVTFINFVEDELKNPFSTASRILNRACDKAYSKHNNSNDRKSSNNIHFSSNRTWISWCLRHHRLFHCDEFYESTELVNEIAESAAKSLYGETKTKQNIADIAEKSVLKLINAYPKFPIEYVVGATREALLYCSVEKFRSSMKCPTYLYQYISHIVLSWFGVKFQYEGNINSHDKELVLN